MIRDQAKAVANSLGINSDKFKASPGWIENFKHRHGIRKGIWAGVPEIPDLDDSSVLWDAPDLTDELYLFSQAFADSEPPHEQSSGDEQALPAIIVSTTSFLFRM